MTTKGGPDGGDGGRGGHIILRAKKIIGHLFTWNMHVIFLLAMVEVVALACSFGKDGADKIIDVPCGTVAYDGEQRVFSWNYWWWTRTYSGRKGGRGGQGNWHFSVLLRIRRHALRNLVNLVL